jgi:hypothetical protein
VTAETDDGRAIATLSFRIEDDDDTGERSWHTLQSALPAGGGSCRGRGAGPGGCVLPV